jgi:hypothetical protein
MGDLCPNPGCTTTELQTHTRMASTLTLIGRSMWRSRTGIIRWQLIDISPSLTLSAPRRISFWRASTERERVAQRRGVLAFRELRLATPRAYISTSRHFGRASSSGSCRVTTFAAWPDGVGALRSLARHLGVLLCERGRGRRAMSRRCHRLHGIDPDQGTLAADATVHPSTVPDRAVEAGSFEVLVPVKGMEVQVLSRTHFGKAL